MYELSRNKIAHYLGADPEEIIFTSGTTESINFIASTWARSNLEEGDEINVDARIGEIESVKSVSDLFSPVKGTVLELNDSLDEDPEKVNESPYDEGWMLKVKLAEDSGLEKLMDASAYAEYIQSL